MRDMLIGARAELDGGVPGDILLAWRCFDEPPPPESRPALAGVATGAGSTSSRTAALAVTVTAGRLGPCATLRAAFFAACRSCLARARARRQSCRRSRNAIRNDNLVPSQPRNRAKENVVERKSAMAITVSVTIQAPAILR